VIASDTKLVYTWAISDIPERHPGSGFRQRLYLDAKYMTVMQIIQVCPGMPGYTMLRLILDDASPGGHEPDRSR
jgi:hypothetical protein